LPLLQQSLGDAVSTERFLVGYAAAQAIPGPMFTLATFLGAELAPARPFQGALLATAGVFLPGFLLVLGLRRAWEGLAARPRIAGAAAGINASVVGLLLATLYQPIFVSAVDGSREMAAVVAGFFLLRQLGVPIGLVVVGFALLGIALHHA
jgi:chromate transporter